GAVGAGGVGWALAGRERGLRLIVSVVVVTQAVLHWSFSLAQSAGQPTVLSTAVGDTGDMPMASMGHHMSSMDMGSMHPLSMGMDHSVHLGSGAPAGLEHWLGGTSMFG